MNIIDTENHIVGMKAHLLSKIMPAILKQGDNINALKVEYIVRNAMDLLHEFMDSNIEANQEGTLSIKDKSEVQIHVDLLQGNLLRELQFNYRNHI